MAHSLTCLVVVGGCQLEPMELLLEHLHLVSLWRELPHNMVARFPGKCPIRRGPDSCTAQPRSHCLLCHMLFLRQASLRLAYIQGKRTQTTPLYGKSVTEFVGIFLNYHQPYMKCAQGIVGIIIKAWPEAHFLGVFQSILWRMYSSPRLFFNVLQNHVLNSLLTSQSLNLSLLKEKTIITQE